MTDAISPERQRTPRKPEPLYCSFCGKPHTEVAVLLAGPTVFICDDCIEGALHKLPKEIRDKVIAPFR